MFDSSNGNNNQNHPSYELDTAISLSGDLKKVLFAHLLLLTTQVTKDNFESKLKEIDYLLCQNSVLLYIKFIRHLISLLLGDIVSKSINKSTAAFIVLQDRLAHITNYVLNPYIVECFENSPLLKVVQLRLFLDCFDLSILDKSIIAISAASSSNIPKENFEFLPDTVPLLIEFLEQNKSESFLQEKVATFLSGFLDCEYFTLYQKLIIFAKVTQSGRIISNSLLHRVVVRFLLKLKTMSAQKIFSEINPSELAPSEMLRAVLSYQTEERLTDAVVFLLTEIIAPTSQFLNGSEHTSLTSSDIVQSTAKGASMEQIFNQLAINWADVIDQLVDKSLQDSYKITVASLSQFLSSLPTTTNSLDYFFKKLTSSSLSSLQELVIVNLHELRDHVSNGGINVLKLILDPIAPNLTNLRESIIYFLNVSKLEVRAVANLQKHGKLVSNALTYYFHEDFSNAPDYLAVGAVSLLEDDKLENEDLNISQIVENLIVPLLDINSMFLTTLFGKLLEYNPAKLAQICNSYIESNGASSVDKIVKLIPKKFTEEILNAINSPENIILFTISAGKNGWPNVAQYLSQRIRSFDDRDAVKFIESFLSVINSEIDYSLDPTYGERLSLPLAYDLMTLFDGEELSGFIVRFKVLESYNELQVKFLQAFPRLSNFGFGHDEAILKAEENSRSFPPDIELKMKNYFEQMYSRHFEIKEITDLLLKLKVSDTPQDQDLFACMLHSIIDEYRFYPTYPTEAIALTSVLFGSLVFFRLFEGTTLKIALRYILDSARMPPDSNMFKFAVQALFASRGRLTEYKSYCAALASIDNLKSHRALYNDIVAISEGNYTAPSGSTPSLVRASTVEHTEIVSKFNSLFIDSIVLGNVEQTLPSEELSESISFFINNLSESNFQSTVSELKKKVSDNLLEYFANILVVQRAKLEPNYQELYYQVVKSFDSKLFDEHLIIQTMSQIIGILNNDDPSDTERQHLKNLGTWLGLISLRRNKPIKNKNMLVEPLLVEAYDSEKLNIVLPFVCKVIGATKDSVIFKHPNPWTLGIVRVLKELYEFGSLSLNLKFEVEVLCNTLKINLKEVEASTIIRNHLVNASLELRVAIDNGKLEAKQALFNPPIQMQDQTQFVVQPQQTAAPLSSAFDVSTAFENIVSQSRNPIFTHSEKMKNLCQFALTRAIKETLPAIVERINAIAIHSARNLVLKDFALDPDETKLFNSAHQLLTTLIESLTPVQCRDSLKQNILMVLRATLEEFPAFEENLTLAVDEITPIGVELIKMTALKGASADLAKFLGSNYMTRISYRGSPQQFVDVSAASRYAIGLPEPLGLKAGGVTAQQYSVYANFGRQSMAISRNNQLLQQEILQQRGSNGFEEQFEEQPATYATVQLIPQQAPMMEPLQQIQQQQQQQQLLLLQQQQQLLLQQQFNQPQILETMLEQTMEKILKATVESPLTSIKEVNDNNPIKLHVAQILAFCLRTPQKDAALLTLAQLVVQALFTVCEKKLTFEVFVSLLESACAFSPSALYDVSHWFVQVYDDRKFNKDVVICLLKSGGLITSTELDTSLSGYILQKNENATRFAIDLLSEIIHSDDVPLLRTEFIGIIGALKVTDSPEVKELFKEMNELQSKDISLEEQFGYIFAQWVKICLHDLLPNAGETRKIFVKQLLDTNILSEKESFVQFLRMATEISVIAFNKENESKKSKVDFYLTTDAYADLIIEILVNIEDNNEFSQRGVVLDTALSVLVVYFADDHKQVATFNQRPYFRIISSLLSNFSEYVSNNPEYKDFEEKFYLVIADKLIAMQPLAFPGFTFAWITLISHRLFLSQILSLEGKAGWTKYISLLVALLNFQSTHVTGKQVPDMLVLVYKGTLRILLLLLHDFPELLVENHYQLTVNIPPSFVQLRNVVLSAFPKDMSFPDPFQPGLKIERIPEITEAPKIRYNPAIDLENASKSLKKNIDNYMRVPSKPLLKNIISALTLAEPKVEGGIGYTKSKYSLKLVNALVLYIGMISINEKQSTFTTNSDECIFLRDLMLESSVELQYQLFEAITNQLRFPNAHTHWFSCIIIYFFSAPTLWGNDRENVQQIITRVLLERTIASRPHPWGLLITFTELLKNSEYSFFDLPFTKAAPEFKTIFGSLLKHIGNSSTTVTTPNV